MRLIKKIFKMLLWLVLIIVVLLSAIVGYFHFTDYRPEAEINIENSGAEGLPQVRKQISVMTWNIGYCGLGAETDFFYDGGKMVKPEKELFDKYYKSVVDFIKANDSIDFILLQEVDRNSKRSYYTDQFQKILDTLQNYCGYFAVNYQCPFVPVPFSSPMGKVNAGLCILSKYKAKSSIRHPFENKEKFPDKYFVLDRCCLINRYPLNDKELVVVNTHNSAYDNGEERKQQVEFLSSLIAAESQKGNAVVLGGDWNQYPEGFDNKKFSNNQSTEWYVKLKPVVKSSFPEYCRFVFDETMPTNRALDRPWQKNNNYETIIDFFIVNNRLELKSVKTIQKFFSDSDHHPVIATFNIL